MNRVLAIALHTFREAVRDRVLHGVLGAGVAGLFVVLALAELSLDQQQRVVADLGLALLSLLSVGVALFLGSSLLARELERRTLYVVLPRPITRWQFLLGKYLGIVWTGAVFASVMGAVLLGVAALQRGGAPWRWAGWLLGWVCVSGFVAWRARDRVLVVAPLALASLFTAVPLAATVSVPWASYLAAVALSVGEVALLSAVTLFYSSFSTPFTTGLLAFGTWIVGRSVGTIASFPEARTSPWLRGILRVVEEVAPNFHLFVPGVRRLSEVGPLGGGWSYVVQALAYGATYSTVALLLAAFVFRRRDLP